MNCKSTSPLLSRNGTVSVLYSNCYAVGQSLARRLVVAVQLGLVCASAVAHAAETEQPAVPGIDLSGYVSADVGLCLEIRQLQTHAGRFVESELYRRLQAFPPFAALLAQQRPHWAAVAGEVERRTGATVSQLYSGLLGRQVLFAVWPPAEGRSAKGDALLLIDANDPELLTESLRRLVEARRAAGRWHGRRVIEAAGRTFSIEVIGRDDEPTDVYLAVDGALGIMATSEAVARGVLERRAGPDSSAESLATLAAYESAVRRLSSDCVAQAFISPRAWDAALVADLERKPPQSEEARSQQIVVDAWRATDYVVGGIELTPRLACELAWQWRSEALPQPVRELAAGMAGRARLTDRIPADAWLAVAGRIDLGRIVRHLISQEWRAGNHSQTIKPETILAWALSAGLGPNFAAYCPSPGDRQHPTEVEAVVAIETQPLEAGDSSPPLAEIAAPLLHSLLSAAVEASNGRHSAEQAKIETTVRDGLAVTSVSGLKAGARPLAFAYAVVEGIFWLGTTPDAIRGSARAASGQSLLSRVEIRRQLGSLVSEPTDLLYVDLARWRSLLAAGPDAMSFFGEGKSLDAAARQRQYQMLLALSQLADHLLAAAQVDDAGVSISLSFANADPR